MNEKTPVAVFDADAPTALAFTRSLGRAGVPVVVYAHRRLAAARLSRYCSGFRRAPDPEDAGAFLPWLEGELETGRIRLVAPTSDLIAFYCAELAPRFDAEAQRAMPSREAVLDALLKDRFAAACERAGFETPRAIYPTSREGLAAEAEALRYPVIIKPRSHVGVGLAQRGELARSAAQLRTLYRPYRAPAGGEALLEKYPALRWPMVQEYVPRALENLYSVSGFISASGEIVASAGAQKIRQWPPRLGVGTLFRAWRDEAMIARGAALARAVLGRGMFELELIRDARSERYVAIDLNPRAYGQITFDIARQIDLPLIWYRAMTGAAQVSRPATRDELVWVHSVPLHLGHLIELARGPERARRLRDYLALFDAKRVDIVADRGDVLPTLYFVATMFRHPGGLIRPFLSQT